MEADRQGNRLRSFLIGGLVGASAVLAAARRGRRSTAPRPTPGGLAAFEEAPCYREVEAERSLERSSR